MREKKKATFVSFLTLKIWFHWVIEGRPLGAVGSKSPHTAKQCDTRMENINSIFFISQGIQTVREKVGTILMIQNHSFSEINEHYVIF